jgi:D-alanine-D-alanine ligase
VTQQGLRVAVLFGGPSVEHDVSIISAQQLMAAMTPRHEAVPVYLARDGGWWTGDALREIGAFGADQPAGAEPCELRLGRDGAPFASPGGSRFKGDRDIQVDAAICAIHGTGGEDGSLLGALELSGVPYVGGGVGAAAVAMDKRLGKLVFAEAGVEVCPHTLIHREDFTRDRADSLRRAAEQGFSCYVKPASLGSSIGVARVREPDELEEALELAFELDLTALVEPALDDFVEVNVAILGSRRTELRASEVEQPVRDSDAALSFEDKYLRGGGKGGGGKGSAGDSKTASRGGDKSGGGSEGMASADRLIPAPISPAAADALVDAAKRAHRGLGLFGVVRYDFFLKDPEGGPPRVVLNEANTVPGSFAFYLFEPAGVSFPELADALLEIAFSEAAERRATTRTFDSILISQHQRS